MVRNQTRFWKFLRTSVVRDEDALRMLYFPIVSLGWSSNVEEQPWRLLWDGKVTRLMGEARHMTITLKAVTPSIPAVSR
jgi:hypothetical protein